MEVIKKDNFKSIIQSMLKSRNCIILRKDTFFSLGMHLKKVFLLGAIRLILLDVLENIHLVLQLTHSQWTGPRSGLLQPCLLRLQVRLWRTSRFAFSPFCHLEKLVEIVLYPTGKHKVQNVYKCNLNCLFQDRTVRKNYYNCLKFG